MNIEQEKYMKLENVDQRIDSMDDSIISWHESNNKKFAGFKDKITEFHKYIEEDKQAKEFLYEARLQELKNLENKILERFE